jgi:autotransporter-associated beta strand protein
MTVVVRWLFQLIFFTIILAGNRASAQSSNNYYWDGGAGNWDTTSAEWRRSSVHHPLVAWQNSASSVAQIGDVGSPGSITVSTTITASSVNFDASGFTLQTDGNPQTLNGNVVLASGVALNLHNAFVSGNQTLNVGGSISGGTGMTIQGAAAAGFASVVNMSLANTTISTPVTVNLAGTGVGGIVATAAGVQISSAITNGSSGATLIGADGSGTFTLTSAAVISGSQGVRFAVGDSGGTGTVTLNSQSNYGGATAFNMASTGVVKLGVNNALPTGTDVTFGVTAGSGGILDLNGFSQQVASLASGTSAAGSIRNNGTGTSTLTVSGATSTTFGLGIADNSNGGGKIALVKSGTGMLTLTGSNTYSGGTTINGGTLIVGGSGSAAGSGSVTVNSGGTLAGNNAGGALTGSVTVASGGTLAPGTGGVSTGILKVANNVTLQSGSTFQTQIEGGVPGAQYGQLSLLAGNVSLSGALSASFGAFTPNSTEKFFIINNSSTTGTLTGTFSNYADGQNVANYGGYTWTIFYGTSADAYGGTNGNDVVIVATPEPATILLLCAAVAGVGVVVHRCRRPRRAMSSADVAIGQGIEACQR